MIEMDRRIRAGHEYLQALNRLGFRPDALFWAMAGGQDEPRLELGIVTSWADSVGPKAVYDLLFEAYDASATPKEIDPFVVTLFSPETQVAADLSNVVRMMRAPGYSHEPSGTMMLLGALDYATIAPWILYHRAVKHNLIDDVRKFRAFQAKVERLDA